MAFYTTPHAHYLELCRALRDGIDVRLQTLDPGSVEARLLQEKRNQLAPISRLPPELFSKIARYIIIEHHGRKRNEDDTFQAVYQQHLVLASVSRSWRQIILEDRILWTDIRTSYLTLAPLLLERSGKAHLTLLLSELHERPKDVIDYGLDLISSHGYRIRELSLRLSSLSNHAVPFLRKPAPAMECFRLSIMEKIDFSYSLFDGSAPCLTKLSLIGVMFPWDMPLLYSLPLLRYLTISRDPDSETPSWDQLTKILRSMPSLKYLKIHYALPSSVVPPHITFEFPPHFDHLCLGGTISDCNTFLNCVSFSNRPTLYISCGGGTLPLPLPFNFATQPWLSDFILCLRDQSVLIHHP